MREEQLTFFNTNHETGIILTESQNKSFNQQLEIYKFLKRNPKKSYTACEIHQIVLPKSPITSPRRALTNLAKAGYVNKLPQMRKGVYGKYVHTWRLA